VRETTLSAADLVQPLFVLEAGTSAEPIESMPGQSRLPLDLLGAVAEQAFKNGVRGVALFPKVCDEKKSANGQEALNPEGLALRAIRTLKAEVPNLLVVADVALDPYTSHGHDGLLDPSGTKILNDETVDVLCQMAVLCAQAGADMVAPSDMMDGRVGAIRRALDEAGYHEVLILAYSAKFNSGFYGPFRDAVGSAQAAGTTQLDKATYQLDPANRRMAQVEALLDEAEGADMLMVKPAGPYLDIIRELRERTTLPLAAYQVSGEYAQLHAAARLGWLDLDRCMWESVLGIKRAGADIILTYFASELAARLTAGPQATEQAP
jgi:porphobilinogen synthase